MLDVGRNIAGDGEATIKPSTVAELPAAAATNAGAVRVCTNSTSGYTLVISNGTSWIDQQTGVAVVSA